MIPVKGERPFFGEAIESLRGQGLGEELEIIIQDGTTEYTEYTENDLRGVRWYREEDRGQSDALNKGFAKANGEWLFWLNADDVLLPGALGKVRDFISRVEGGGVDSRKECKERKDDGRVDWIAGDTVYIDEQGKVIEVRTDAKWRSWFGKKLSVWTGGPSAFFKRELWEKRGGFDAELKYAMDIDLWTRWAQAGEKFVGLGDYVWGFRVHGGSQTMNGENSAAQIAERRAIDARHGVSSDGFWRNVTRLASVLDGSWSKRKRDSRAMKGLTVEELRGILHSAKLRPPRNSSTHNSSTHNL